VSTNTVDSIDSQLCSSFHNCKKFSSIDTKKKKKKKKKRKKVSFCSLVSSFCDQCGDTITKPRIKRHAQQCNGAWYFSCLDCQQFFDMHSIHSHTKCISEAEKYGAVQPNKNTNHNNNARKASQAKQVAEPKRKEENEKKEEKHEVSKSSRKRPRRDHDGGDDAPQKQAKSDGSKTKKKQRRCADSKQLKVAANVEFDDDAIEHAVRLFMASQENAVRVSKLVDGATQTVLDALRDSVSTQVRSWARSSSSQSVLSVDSSNSKKKRYSLAKKKT
jgi:LYAR-type C2HC zinc finger